VWRKNLLTSKRLTGILAVAAFGILSNLDTAVAQTLVATPSPVNFNVQTGGTAPSQNVNITLNGASVTIVSVSASTTTGQNWLLPSIGSSSVFVSVNAAGLTAGTYSGTVTANTSSGTINFPVNLTVAATPTLNVNPAALNFAYQAGTAAPLPQTITLTSSGSSTNATVTSSTNTGGTQWLIVSPTGPVTTPTQITVNIQPANLAVGTYTGNIQIVSAGGGANATVNIPVSLLISNNPIISANPASLTFTAQVGGGAPPAQSLSITSSGGALAYTAASSVGSPPGGGWLQVPTQSGATNGAISVSIVTAGLPVGTYIGTINLTAPNAGNGNLSVPVTLNITAGPALQLSVPTLSFAYQVGQAQPLSQTVTVGSTSGQVSFTVAAQTSTGAQWLSASPANGIAPGNFVVTVNTTGLTPGTYTGIITVTPSGATPQTIQVTLVVSNTALLVLSPNAASFTATVGTGITQSQNVAVTSTDGTPLNFSVGLSMGTSWLLVNTSSASTPANLSLSANPSGLAAGTYTGTVTITASSAAVTNSPQTLPVTLNVTSANTLSVAPASLSFTQAPGALPPPPQTVSVTSTGATSGQQITFAATVSLNQGQGWLTVSPSNATTPANLTVTTNGAGLVAGTYTGQIILSSPGVTPQTISVALSVGSSGGLGSAGSMAHLAAGGFTNQNPWKTIITLVNTGTAASQARLNFFNDNGNPLPLSLSFPQISPIVQPAVSTLDRVLSPGATLIIETNGPDNQPTQTGWAQLLTSGNINGFAVFRQFVGTGGQQQEAVVPVENRNAGTYILTFDNSAGFVTGVAIANTSGQAAVVPVTIRDDNGVVLQPNSIALQPLGHTQFALTDRFPITVLRRGTLEFQTPAGGGISVLGLRFNPALAFSTIPALVK
jgi:hypothetical protein